MQDLRRSRSQRSRAVARRSGFDTMGALWQYLTIGVVAAAILVNLGAAFL